MYPDPWTDYMWLVICGAIMSFVMAMGIGANDVANSFGTSVGAKTVTLKQACIIAAIFEFGGAVGLGGEVIKTIAGSIARPAAFYDFPEIFAFGMLVALVAATSWVFLATYLCVAVSTTHSIIGAVLGFALVYGGKDAVVWNDPNWNTATPPVNVFPYSKGLVPVVCSWFVSPISAGVAAAFLFFMNRLIILRRENSTTWAIYMYPILVMVTVFINVFFVIYKGAKNVANWKSDKAAWVAACVAAGCFVLACIPGIPLLRWIVKRDMDKAAQKAADAEANAGKSKEEQEPEPEPTSKAAKIFASLKKAATHGLNQDVHAAVEKNQDIHDMHAAAEVFDPETEQVYKYLQVFSACAVAFAHGANDVANAVGPFTGIWYVYRNWTVSSNGDSPYWIMAMGGAGIVLGLATYGYNIMFTLGVGIAKMTPSRGFCAELSTALVVSLASVYGLPVSTTQCITGAELGVGLVENVRTGTNWKLFGKQVLAWVFTLIVAGFLSAALFAVGAYAPSITMSKDITVYENNARYAQTAMLRALDTNNRLLNSTFGKADDGTWAFDRTLNTTTANTYTTLTNMFNSKKIGYVDPTQLMTMLNSSILVYNNYSMRAVGFNVNKTAYVPNNTNLAGSTVQAPGYSTGQIFTVSTGASAATLMGLTGYSTLAAANANITSYLSSATNTYTLFAPNNWALAKFVNARYIDQYPNATALATNPTALANALKATVMTDKVLTANILYSALVKDSANTMTQLKASNGLTLTTATTNTLTVSTSVAGGTTTVTVSVGTTSAVLGGTLIAAKGTQVVTQAGSVLLSSP